MSKETKKGRDVVITLHATVGDSYQMLEDVAYEIRGLIIRGIYDKYRYAICLSDEERDLEHITVTKATVTGEGFYHLVPNEPQETQ